MRQEESFGVIPLQKQRDGWCVFLVQHRQGKHWGFPKGRASEREGAQEAAFRELKEETHFDVCRCIRLDPLIETYHCVKGGQKIAKTVFYFLCEVKGQMRLQEREISKGRWCSFHEAYQLLTYAEGKGLLVEVARIVGVDLSVV